ncbi:MAG: hypothetical protein KGZ58_00565 [Ignavibacteriales bacterium]|nr:hypothetical protein [Ignavibacteriales bacterium]
MKTLLFSLPIFFLLIVVQMSSIEVPVKKNISTEPIQLSEYIVCGNTTFKCNPIVYPEVMIYGESSLIQKVKYYPPQMPEVIVIG